MTDLYLIAHKVRGEPAFDVATKIPCPECKPRNEDNAYIGCNECDMLGYWWIIPTSGHRAYPWNSAAIWDLAAMLGDMPPDLPDHYPTRTEPKLDLAELLGFRKPKPPTKPFHRRF